MGPRAASDDAKAGNERGRQLRRPETHNATKRSMIAWWALVFPWPGPSNSQQGYVGTICAKVQ